MKFVIAEVGNSVTSVFFFFFYLLSSAILILYVMLLYDNIGLESAL